MENTRTKRKHAYIIGLQITIRIRIITGNEDIVTSQRIFTIGSKIERYAIVE